MQFGLCGVSVQYYDELSERRVEIRREVETGERRVGWDKRKGRVNTCNSNGNREYESNQDCLHAYGMTFYYCNKYIRGRKVIARWKE